MFAIVKWKCEKELGGDKRTARKCAEMFHHGFVVRLPDVVANGNDFGKLNGAYVPVAVSILIQAMGIGVEGKRAKFALKR